MADSVAADQHAPGAARRRHPGTGGRGGREECAGHVRAMDANGPMDSAALIAGRTGVTQDAYETIQARFVAVYEEQLMP